MNHGPFPLYRLFPHIITLLALCAGMSSLRFALTEKWELAVIFILVAAFLDGMDGRIARLLKATTPFGAQLDSLADFVSFGVMPAFVLYLWKLHTLPIRGLGWILTLFFVMCMAIRLARFNATLDDKERQQLWSPYFFAGIPAPAAAGLSLIPLMLSFEFSFSFPYAEEALAFYIVIIGLLMISRIPTFSCKKLAIPHQWVSVLFIGIGIVIALILIEPWITLPLIGLCYLGSIPWSSYCFQQRKNRLQQHGH